MQCLPRTCLQRWEVLRELQREQGLEERGSARGLIGRGMTSTQKYLRSQSSSVPVMFMVQDKTSVYNGWLHYFTEESHCPAVTASMKCDGISMA